VSAGLSSSSALVVCAALATLRASSLTLTRTELADLCAASERYVGTQGGGMDQAISCLAEADSAKLIDFNPLHVTNINLPSGSHFVITNSCVEANKAAANYFNTRVAECRLSTQVLTCLIFRNIKLRLCKFILKGIGKISRIRMEKVQETTRAPKRSKSNTFGHDRTC
jgi:galactokinase